MSDDKTLAELGIVSGCLGILSGVTGSLLVFLWLWGIDWRLAVGVALICFANMVTS